LLFFFYLVTAQDLWKTITSVSNAGAKRGRAKRRGATKFKDLNLGQRIGQGNELFILYISILSRNN
jgi:small subunit ribosomal protein S5